MSADVIKTEKPRKGDLVVGHEVFAFLPNMHRVIPGKIVAVSDSGHSVTMDIDEVLAIFGLPKRTTWTWRKSVGAYQQKGSRTSPGWWLARRLRKRRQP